MSYIYSSLVNHRLLLMLQQNIKKLGLYFKNNLLICWFVSSLHRFLVSKRFDE